MARCLLALGSNLGDRSAMLRRACRAVARLPDTQLLARSPWHQTDPVGGPSGQGDFLNGALLVQTGLPPIELAKALQAIEVQLGRERAIRWDARSLDIDLLLIDELVIDLPDLTIPHPRMSFRQFVLGPAAEIAGSMRHPTIGWTVAQLRDHLSASRDHVTIVAADRRLAAWLAEQLRVSLGWPRSRATGRGSAVPDGVELIGPSSTAERAEKSPSLVISLDPNDSTSLFAAAQVDQPPVEPTSRNNFPENIEKNILGPIAKIQVAEPSAIVNEAITVVRSAWPESPIAPTY